MTKDSLTRSAPQRPPGVRTRDQILDAAEELISRHGMEGLRLKEVAARVGIQPPSIFAHFAGREAIGHAVAERVIAQIADLLTEVMASEDETERILRRGIGALAEHLVDHPGHVRMLLRDLARTRNDPEVDLTSPRFDEVAEQLGALFGRGEAEGIFRRVDPAFFMSVAEGALLAAIAWHGFDAEGGTLGDRSREEILREVEHLLLGYLRLDPTASG